MLDEIKETLKIASEEPKRYDETRQKWIDTSSQKVDNIVTGGLQKINMPGAEFIGDRARNITGFAQDMTIPESWELPLLGGGLAIAAAEPTPFGEALVGLKYGTGVTSRAYRAGKKVLKKPIAVGTAMAANIVDDAFSRANSLFNRNNPNWRLATPDGADLAQQSAQPMRMTGNQKNPDITPNITKANERTLKRMGLWEAFREFDVDEFDGKVTRKQAKAIVTPEIPGFTKNQAERLGKLPELRSFYSNLTDAQIIPELDHINPLKLTAYLMDKTTGARRVGIRKIILDEGIYLGEMAENFRALPREVHAVWTRNMNRIMGKQLDTFLAEMSSLGITKPEDIAREYVRRIKDGNVKFNKIYEAHKRTYGTVTDSNIDDLISKLDDAYELGDDWAPARTRETRRDINTDLSNLDETPLNVLPEGNQGLNRVVNQLGLDDVTDIDMKEFSKLSLSDQMSQLEKRSGMNIDEIQQLLQASDIDLQTILDMIE